MTATISVVLPTLNSMPYAPASLASIVSQTLAPVEVVVADGGSTDGTLEACRAAGPLVRVLDAAHTGLSGSYNLAAEAARGDVLAFAAGDDVFLPEKLERQLAALEREDADACICAAESFLDGPAPPGFRPELLDAPRVVRLPEALLVRREAFWRVGGFDEHVQPAGDVDWFARAGVAGLRFARVEEVLLRKRWHGTSTAHTGQGMTTGILRSMRASIERQRG